MSSLTEKSKSRLTLKFINISGLIKKKTTVGLISFLHDLDCTIWKPQLHKTGNSGGEFMKEVFLPFVLVENDLGCYLVLHLLGYSSFCSNKCLFFFNSLKLILFILCYTRLIKEITWWARSINRLHPLNNIFWKILNLHKLFWAKWTGRKGKGIRKLKYN